MIKICLVFILSAFVPLCVLAQKEKPIPVLIVDGFSNHDWKQTTAVTKWILEESGRFHVDVSTIPSDSLERSAWNPDFSKYALIVQNTNNIQNPALRWSRPAEKQLEEYVRNGGGLYILHSANNAFSHWKEYDKMIGLGWRKASQGSALEIEGAKKLIRIAPGEGEGTGHGDRFNALIQILTSHPINRGYPHQWQTANTEVYFFPRGPAENISVLSCAFDSTSTKRTWPVEWVVKYGKGRVYNSSLGHLWKGERYPPAYRCIGYQTTVIRAAEWLATGKVTFPVPSDFPTAAKLSLRPENSYKTP
jgi:type 1 glutamine amidotransferase